MRGILLPGTLALATIGSVAALAATAPALEKLNATETELSADQSKNEHQLARLLSVLEQLKRDPPPALLVSPQDAKDAVRAAILVKAMTPQLQGRAQVYAMGASEVMRQRRLAAVQSEALFESDSRAADTLPEPQETLPLRGPLPAAVYGPLTPPASLLPPASGTFTRRFGEALPGGGRSNG